MLGFGEGKEEESLIFDGMVLLIVSEREVGYLGVVLGVVLFCLLELGVCWWVVLWLMID